MATIVAATRHAPRAAGAGLLRRRPLVAYFALAYAGSWLVLAPAALSRGEHGLGLLPFAVPDVAAFALAMLAVYTGPLLAAVLVAAASDGRAGLRHLRGRVGAWRVGPGWYLVALLAPLTIWLALYGAILRGAPLAALARDWPLLATAFLPNVAVGLLLPALGEETGWRGFALPRLQRRHSPVVATLLLGALHSLWHLPAFFTAGLGPFAPGRFAAFALTGLAATFLFTWVLNRARGSALPAILLHAAFNAAAGLMGRLIPAGTPFPDRLGALDADGWLNVLAFGVAALLLVALTRGRLGYRAVDDRPFGAAARVAGRPAPQGARR